MSSEPGDRHDRNPSEREWPASTPPPDESRDAAADAADAPPDLAEATDDDVAAEFDRHDPRRRDDPMAPPTEPCECYCLHCGRTFMSDGMWLQRVIGDPGGFPGYWMCPTPNCDGAGFTFDIFPTDPAHPSNAGWHSVDDDDDDNEEGEGDDGGWEPERWDADDPEADAEYDPDESKYKALDEVEFDDDDLEGEEWKYGLQPGERPESGGTRFADEESQRQWEAQQRSYDEPDLRPREVDGSKHEDPKADRPPRAGGGEFDEEDIPF